MKRILNIMVIIIFSLLAASCKKESMTAAEKKIIAAQVGEPKSLDPHSTNDKRSLEVMVQIYDTLVELDNNLEIKPLVAEKWEMINPETIRFTIRKGIKFHNGDDLKVEDILFSLNRMRNSSVVKTVGESIKDIRIVDENTIDIETKYSFKPLLKFLSDPAASIVSEEAVKQLGKDYGQNPVGTGSFKMKEWIPGEKIELVKNENHFLKRPKIDKLIFRSIPEATNRLIGLETEELDLAYAISPIDAAQIEKNSKLSLLNANPLAIEFIGFNTEKGVFQNKDLRKAVIYALNAEEILGTVLGKYAININSPLAPNMFGYTESRATYNQNIKKAKEYMKKAGFENGVDAEITIHSNNDSMQISQIIQAQLKEIGINLKINPLEWGTFIRNTSNGEHELFHMGKTSPTGDGAEALSVFNSDLRGAPGNRFFYSNKEVDEALNQGKKELDDSKRKNLYERAIEIIQEEGVMAFSFTRTVLVGINSKISGFEPHPSGIHRFSTIDKN